MLGLFHVIMVQMHLQIAQ